MNRAPADFLGRWRIERTIEDSLAGSASRFVGDAVIARGDVDWTYRETGTLTLASAAQLRAERTYYWQPKENGFEVYFADRRFFHSFALDDNAEAKHWCDPDQYDVAYDFARWPEWSSTWDVTGPRKRYVMLTRYYPSE
ncbi:MAG: DUF6314 family protein [Planktotalea sp.]|uniref:DUF6314 family protein n=1 Tax=Planktotalea sp. TaxID=2029877 RepID=UPI003C77A18B